MRRQTHVSDDALLIEAAVHEPFSSDHRKPGPAGQLRSTICRVPSSRTRRGAGQPALPDYALRDGLVKVVARLQVREQSRVNGPPAEALLGQRTRGWHVE